MSYSFVRIYNLLAFHSTSADHWLMNDREAALLSYLRAIALDRRVLRAVEKRSGDDLLNAVYACVKEDLPSVGRIVFSNLLKVGVKKVEPVVQMVVGQIFGEINNLLDLRKRR